MTIGTGVGEIDRRLLMDRSVPGRKAFTLPESDVPIQELPDASLLRDDIEQFIQRQRTSTTSINDYLASRTTRKKGGGKG